MAAHTFSLKKRNFNIRRLTREDTAAYVTFFNALSDESIRCRFGHLIANLTPSSAESRILGVRQEDIALAVFGESSATIIAIGRCCFDSDFQNAEISLVVAESSRKLGLGRFLLNYLVEVARAEKVETIEAFIATKNAPVLVLLRAAGFEIETNEPDEDLRLVLKITE